MLGGGLDTDDVLGDFDIGDTDDALIGDDGAMLDGEDNADMLLDAIIELPIFEEEAYDDLLTDDEEYETEDELEYLGEYDGRIVEVIDDAETKGDVDFDCAMLDSIVLI